MGTGVYREVAEAVRRAGRILQAAGYAVEEQEPPAFAEVARDWGAFAHGEAGQFMADAFANLADAGAQETFRFMLAHCPPLDMAGYMTLAARRTTHQRAWAVFQQDWPLVLCPVSAEPPFPQGLDVPGQQGFDAVYRAQQVLLATPLLGLPSVSVPTGLTEAGLPMGVQIIAPRWREDLALAAAELVEAACPMAAPVDPRAG